MAKLEIPGYKIQRELGHGGMAHVYLAIQESFGREVALKVLSPHLADDEEFSKRFLREARIVSQLNHPNIVTVFDAGKHGKYNYMSMEYIPGEDLRQLKDDISRKEALRIVKDVARALDFAGNKGVVHRDIKPENIMIHKTDNRVILMDFGIAHGDDVTHGMTQTGKAIGTPHFMSPEQTKGLKVDHRSDIYSLGIVLYQLLAGHLPFDADSAVAVGIKHLTAPIPLLPGGLEIFQPIVNHCLSKQPEHRYQKAADIVAALDKITDEQLENIDTQAVIFKQTGANHDAATQIGDIADVSDAVISNKRKIPDIVFPSSSKKTVLTENPDDTNPEVSKKSNRRRNLLFLLLITTLVWAGNEKQKELTQYWGYTALPKIVEIFPNLFPQSYNQYWLEKEKLKQAKAAVLIAAEQNKLATAQNAQNNLIEGNDTAQLISSETQAAIKTPKKDKITLLKEGLENNPENATQLATIYKEMLLQSKDDAVAQEGLKELKQWYIKQIRLAFATEDAAQARQLINTMKQSFPQAVQNKRFIRLEKKVAFLERINGHLVTAENYFKAGALSKPINRNALDEINKVLILAPGNEDAKNFINKIVESYLEKTTQLQQQGNIHNAVLMVEEGIAALNDPKLIQKRKDLKDRIKHNKNVVSLFKQAEKYQTEGQLIRPRAYNAYDLYTKILEKEKDNLQAKAGLKTIHQQLAKNIIALIHKGELKNSEDYLQAAIQRYGKSSLLANVQLKLNDALDQLAPKIETMKLSDSPVNNLITKNSANAILQLKQTLYIGFNFINFDPKTTWLDATLFNNNGRKIAQKPVVISSQFGEHFFEVNLSTKYFTNDHYKLELKLKNRVLISKSFSVQN